MDLTLVLQNLPGIGLLWCGISGKQLGKLPHNESMDIPLTLLAISPGLQVRHTLNVYIPSGNGNGNVLFNDALNDPSHLYSFSVYKFSYRKYLTVWLHFTFGKRCSSVVRAFAHGVMGCWIDPSWSGTIELFLFPASAPQLE